MTPLWSSGDSLSPSNLNARAGLPGSILGLSSNTLISESGNTINVLSTLSAAGGIISSGSARFGGSVLSTHAAVETLVANSNLTDYLYFEDSSLQRSSYLLGSHAGGTVDGLNIFDTSGNTMIVSFSKTSTRFFGPVVGPVFDTGGALSSTYNAALFLPSGSKESRIQAAINAAVADGIARVYVPANLYPYSSASISFSSTVQMVREGGNWSVFDVKAYGAAGDGTRADAALNAAELGAGYVGGVVYVPAGVYRLNSVVTIRSNTETYGDGAVSVLSLGADLGAAMLFIGAVSNIRLRGLKLTGQRSTYTSSANVAVGRASNSGGASNVIVDDLTVNDWAGLGISFLATTGSHDSGIVIRRCRVSNTGAHNIVCQDYVDNNTIADNICENWSVSVADNAGIAVGRTSVNQVVTNNELLGTNTGLGTSQHGITLDSGTGASVSNNIIRMGSSTGFAIEVGFTAQVAISNNVVYGGVRTAIALTCDPTGAIVTRDVVIQGNVINGGSANGIDIIGQSNNTATDIVISANEVRGCGLVGIQINRAYGVAVVGNYVTGCGKSGIFVANNVLGSVDSFAVVGNVLLSNNTTGTADHTNLRVDIPSGSGPNNAAILVKDNIFKGNGGSYPEQFLTAGGADTGRSLIANDTTPNVAVSYNFNTNNTSATSYAAFEGATPDKVLALTSGDTYSGILQNANIQLSGSTDWKMGLGDSIALARSESNLQWMEIGRAYANSFLIPTFGSAILPAAAFGSERSLGWYRSAASVMALSYGGLNMPRGTNASFGTALLSVGSIKVSTTYIATGDIVMLASQGGGTLGNLGALEVNGITSGTSFNINSTSATDNNVVAWWIIKSH